MSDKSPETILECSLRYAIRNEVGDPVAQGQGRVRLSPKDLALLPSLGQTVLFSLREVESFSAGDHLLCLQLSSGESLELSHLGLKYDDFCRELMRLRHEMAIGDLLMQERLITSGLKARYTRIRGDGNHVQGSCEIRLYETALLLLPETTSLERIPYSYISAMREQGYEFTIEVEDDGLLTLSRLGPGLDLLRGSLSATLNDLALSTQRYLQELLPDVEPSVIRRAAPLLRDGRAARRADLDRLSPDLWPALEERLTAIGMADRFAFLSPLAQSQEICLGMKRGLMGDLTGDYMWALLPIYSTDPGAPGNAVAMETAAATGGGRRATYFYRLTGRKDYRARSGDLDSLHRRAAALARRLSRCLLAVNFRREPIYLSAEKLREPRYDRYRVALRRIPELRMLRELFVGRVVQASPEQWQRDVMDLLRFNVSAIDDSPKWRAPAVEEQEEDGDEEE